MSIRSGKYPKYTLLPRLSRYVLNSRYHIDNNGVENAIRPLAIGRKNYLFCGNHDAAVRAAIVYSLFSCCKAHDIDVRIWLGDILKRIPTEKDINQLLPGNWKVLPANNR
jgi:hypothetical protein